MQIQPPIALCDFIKHYLLLKSGQQHKKLRLFSDGNTGIVFSLKNQLAINHQNNLVAEPLPGSFLYGQITAFKHIHLYAETTLIVVVFKPAGINNLLGLPAHELRDHIVRTEDVFGKEGLILEEKLSEKNTTTEIIKILNSFFIEQAAKKKHKAEWLLRAALNFISGNKGVTSLKQLVKFTGYTERHLERKFMETIGTNPKRFINIVKLHSCLKHLNTDSAGASLTQIAYEAGYADQSHLIKAFKKHTGMTPKSYKDKADKVAVNFVAFPPSAAMSDLYNLPK